MLRSSDQLDGQLFLSSVQPRCSLCLFGDESLEKTHHRDTENTEADRESLTRVIKPDAESSDAPSAPALAV
jgi:hypothetical protein